MVSIEGYRIFRNDRDANGEGVAIYVKNSRKTKLKSENLELLSVEISPGRAKPSFSRAGIVHQPLVLTMRHLRNWQRF